MQNRTQREEGRAANFVNITMSKLNEFTLLDVYSDWFQQPWTQSQPRSSSDMITTQNHATPPQYLCMICPVHTKAPRVEEKKPAVGMHGQSLPNFWYSRWQITNFSSGERLQHQMGAKIQEHYCVRPSVCVGRYTCTSTMCIKTWIHIKKI